MPASDCGAHTASMEPVLVMVAKWRRAIIEACGDECHRDDEPLEDEGKVLAGHPDANMPALLTKDVRGG